MVGLAGLMFALLLDFAGLGQANANRGYCLQADDARRLASNYESLITRFSMKVAEDVLAPDFTLYSTSAQALINRCSYEDPPAAAPMAPLYSTRAAFVKGQWAQAPPYSYEQLDLWYACDTITVRYQYNAATTTTASGIQSIVGMTTMWTRPGGLNQSHWIQSVYTEYDLNALKTILGDCNGNQTEGTTSGGP